MARRRAQSAVETPLALLLLAALLTGAWTVGVATWRAADAAIAAEQARQAAQRGGR